ncbi:hypothetical protein [Thalassobaculum sp.]|uniref:hypothetical protein n=1 Tax=Thalassobaculum sp. TaxID=2022740 RepID=UPI0032EADF42
MKELWTFSDGNRTRALVATIQDGATIGRIMPLRAPRSAWGHTSSVAPIDVHWDEAKFDAFNWDAPVTPPIDTLPLIHRLQYALAERNELALLEALGRWVSEIEPVAIYHGSRLVGLGYAGQMIVRCEPH